MSQLIRARFNRDTLVVYQAYREAIGRVALEAGRFVPPFSLNRMTWIKPSFLWMMQRSGWGTKSGQEWVLGIHIGRADFEAALARAVLTSPESKVYRDAQEWSDLRQTSPVLVQWDPEYSLRGAKLTERSLQVGLGRGIIQEYAEQWVVKLEDMRPLVARLRDLRQRGRWDEAARLLPVEKLYPLPAEVGRRIGLSP
jgi:hypothetical protein